MKKKIKVLSLLAVAALGGAGVLAIGTNGMISPFGITASEDNVRSFVITAEEIRAALGSDGSSSDRKSGTLTACGLGFSVSGAYYADGKINIAGGSIYNSDLAGATVDANKRVGTGFKKVEIKGLDSKNGMTASFQDDSLTDIEAISVDADSAGDKTIALSKSGKASRVKLDFVAGEGTSFTSIVFTYTCGDATPTIDHIESTESEIAVDETCVLTAKTSYTTSSATYTWTSSGTGGVSIVQSTLTPGNTIEVLGTAEGEVTITCVLQDGEYESTATYTIKVTKAKVAATGVEIADKSSLGSMTLHSSVKLSATATPADTTDEIVWSSSDTDILSVGSDGTVIAMGEGEATITATCGTVADTVSITVAGNPVLDASKITNLYGSYKASVNHSYLVDVTHGGKSADDAFDYKADTPITSTYSGTLPPSGTLAMNIPLSDISCGKDCYVKFTIPESKTGTYGIFSNNPNVDMKLVGVYEVNDGGVVSSTAIDDSDDDDGAKDATNGGYYGQYRYDFYKEFSFEAGKSYVADFRYNYGTLKSLLFGVVKIEAGATTVTNAIGDPAKKTVTDPYSFTYIENEGAYRQNADDGIVDVEGELHQFSHNTEDDEYVYENAALTGAAGAALTPAYLSNLISWDAILSNSALEYVGSDAEGHIDTYSVDIDSSNLSSLGSIASFIYFLGLNDVSASVSKFAVAHDYVNMTATISLTFEDTTEPNGTVVTIEEANAFPVTVVGHNVHNGGAGGDDSGVDQEW